MRRPASPHGLLRAARLGDAWRTTRALKASWASELPFGRGRRFFGNAGGVLDRIVRGSQIHGALWA